MALTKVTYSMIAGQLDATNGLVNAVPVANGGTGASTASAARTNLGLVIGTNVPSPTGTGASGTWGINVTGNAATATTSSSCSGNSSTATTSLSCSGNSSTATQLTTASGTAPSYSARAWVNFDGTGTVGTNMTIFGSGNVSSVYKNATGDYTVNFTTALPNANYAVSLGISSYLDTRGVPSGLMIKSAGLFTTTGPATKTTSALQVVGGYGNNGGGFFDVKEASLIIFC